MALERVNAFAKLHELAKTKRDETRKKINELIEDLGIITACELVEIHQTMNREQKEIENAFIEVNGTQVKINYLINEITRQFQF